MIFPSDLDRLEALARAATPGPLDARCTSISDRRWALISRRRLQGEEFVAAYMSENDALFYKEANPSTVLRLIEECRRKM